MFWVCGWIWIFGNDINRSNLFYGEIKRRLNLRKACCLSVQNLLSFFLYLKTWRLKYSELYFVQWANKCTINWQSILLLLHVATLLCHLHGACSQYLLSYISMLMQSWWYNLKWTYFCNLAGTIYKLPEEDTVVSKHVGEVW
jgi:hypothetical protein